MKRLTYIYFTLLVAALLFSGCRKEKIEPLSIGLKDNYAVERLGSLVLESGVESPEYIWIILSHEHDGKVTEINDTISREQRCVAVFSEIGIYHMEFILNDPDNYVVRHFRVHVDKELSEYSPLAVEVLNYRPAPGTYVNLSPPAPTSGENVDANYYQMRQRCEAHLRAEESQEISLGAFGGSITLAFDHLVLNKPNAYDFVIPRNINNVEGRTDMIVWVAYDQNKNGKPDDDEWYMLKTDSEIINKSLSVTYSAGNQDKMASADDDKRGFDRVEHVVWRAGSESGFLPHLKAINNPNYMPITWLSDWNTAPYIGVQVADRADVQELKGTDGSLNSAKTTLTFKPYNEAPSGADPLDFGMDIGWAVDAEGNAVDLPGIHFVKLVSAVHKQVPDYGPLGVSFLCVKDLTLRTGE